MKKNYKKTNNSEHLIRCQDITDKLNAYLVERGLETVKNSSVGVSLRSVFGTLSTTIKSCDGQSTILRYRCLKEIGSDQNSTTVS